MCTHHPNHATNCSFHRAFFKTKKNWGQSLPSPYVGLPRAPLGPPSERFWAPGKSPFSLKMSENFWGARKSKMFWWGPPDFRHSVTRDRINPLGINLVPRVFPPDSLGQDWTSNLAISMRF